jgi:hypothetical protein
MDSGENDSAFLAPDCVSSFGNATLLLEQFARLFIATTHPIRASLDRRIHPTLQDS